MKQLNVEQVRGENNDLQFTSTGNAMVDLVGNGADVLLEKSKPDLAEKFRKLAQGAYETNPKMCVKVGRYFRDRARGQGLKEQPLLLIACLHDSLTQDEILDILLVHRDDTEGAIPLGRVDFLDLVRILAWHKYIFGRKARLSNALLGAMSHVVEHSDFTMEQVLKYKGKDLSYTPDNSFQVGIVDVLGMIRKSVGRFNPELAKEYDDFLQPRYRGKDYGAQPTSALGIEQRKYFLGDLPEGEVPRGVTIERVLSRKDSAGLATLAKERRLSPYQFKINLGSIMDAVSNQEAARLVDHYDLRMYPHEIYAMGKAFIEGTEHTKVSAAGESFVDEILKRTVDRYRQKVNKRVLFLGDTSGSMGGPLSQKSTVRQSEFSAFMSFFAGHVMGDRVFGTWDSDARIYQARKSPSVRDCLDTRMGSDCNTDVISTIKTVADWYVEEGLTCPDTICLISDMQFDQALSGWGYGRRHDRSESIDVATRYYRDKTGIDPEIVYWNVNSKTCPTTQEKGATCISGFSANTADIVFGVIEQAREERKAIALTDVVEWIDAHYA